MNKKVQLIIFFAIFLILGGICIFTYNSFNGNSNKVNNSEKLENTIKDDYKYNNIDNNDGSVVSTPEFNVGNKLESNDNGSSDLKNEIIYQESDVITYFTSVEEEFDNNKDNVSFKDKAKGYFITIVDFLFYDSEIKGYTFNELTSSAKLKILEIVFSIDNKIDSYFPNYKDIIKEKMTDIKGKIVVKYLEITASICSENSDLCDTARESFNNMKNSYGITWDIVKEVVGNGYSSLKTILSEWYKSIKE